MTTDLMTIDDALRATRGQDPGTDAFNVWNLGGDARLAQAVGLFRCAVCGLFARLFVHRDGGTRCVECDHDYCGLKKKGWN